MSPDRIERFHETLEERKLPLCWALVRVYVAGKGRRTHYKKEELHVYHNSTSAKMEYNRLLAATNNKFTIHNLKLVSRRQRFGEGVYI